MTYILSHLTSHGHILMQVWPSLKYRKNTLLAPEELTAWANQPEASLVHRIYVCVCGGGRGHTDTVRIHFFN